MKSHIVVNPDEEKRELEAKIRIKDGVSEKKAELEVKLKEYKETKEKMQKQQDLIEKRVVPIINELAVLQISQLAYNFTFISIFFTSFIFSNILDNSI